MTESSYVTNADREEHRVHSIWSVVVIGGAGFIAFFCGSIVLAVAFWANYGLPFVSVVCVCLGLVLSFRTLRIRLIVGSDWIVVTNVFRTHRLGWNSVNEIGWHVLSIGLGVGAGADSPVLAFKLHSGKVVSATATGDLGGKKARRLAETIQMCAAAHSVRASVTADDLRGWPPRELPKTQRLQ